MAMVLAALYRVSKYFGEMPVLQGATLELRTATRTALIGRNGAGKTTILRLLSGREVTDDGETFLRQGTTVGILQQDPRFVDSDTVLDLANDSFVELERLESKLEVLEAQGLEDPGRFASWEVLHETFERRGGYQRRARRDAVLHALAFRGREEQKISSLSGGEKTRLGLACLLMRQPDVLLLDEPTNHLDLEMRGWLEGYLSRYPGAALIVSHDRLFLDRSCEHTAEIARATLRTFKGTPSAYREARKEQLRIDAVTRTNQQKEYARLEAAAAQMKKWARQNAKLHRRAKAMERRLERFAADMLPEPERGERTTRFQFPCEESGELVLQAEHLSKSFEHTLFEDVNVMVRRGERIGLVGPNGAGKTTFLRLMLGEDPSDDPRARLQFGAKVRVGYYDQQLAGVDPEKTLIEELIRLVGDIEAHNLLGHFLFPFEAQYKRIADLSGGERARLALLKLTLGHYNFLLLDEPTNHLDVEMIEATESALASYRGTLLVVSHDRSFIEKTCRLIWDLRDGKLRRYPGGWEYYQRKRQDEVATREVARGQKEKRDLSESAVTEVKGPSKWQLERTIEALEQQITALEEELDDLAATLSDPVGLPSHEISALAKQHDKLQGEAAELLSKWEEASEALMVGKGRKQS
ncbi:MAG: ABC-F family ATP-binding cassette domain-containing protein [Trueperaceae bacterium]|nr:MAG: ABC-F family ATP-binding cassette domain-containing protein [Trueperaceae bacterium]